jgi:hypothetical protein
VNPTVTGVFRLIDRASSVLDKIDRNAKKVDRTLVLLGRRFDALQKKVDGLTVSLRGANAQLDEFGRKKATARVDIDGIATAIAQLKTLDAAIDSVEKKVNVRTKTNGGLLGRLFGAIPTGGNSNLQAMLGSVEYHSRRLIQTSKPLIQTLAGVSAGAFGVVSAFGMWGPILAVALAAIPPLTGALTALLSVLAGAVGGAGLVGGGLIGAFVVGIGSVVAVIKTAISPLKEYNKAVDNLNKAMASGDPRKIAEAQKIVNRLAAEHPRIAKLRTEFDKLKEAFKDATKPSQARALDMMISGLRTARTLLSQHAGDIRDNFAAAANAMEAITDRLSGPRWRGIITGFSQMFQGVVGPISRGVERFAAAIGELILKAGPDIERFARGFERAGAAMLKWAEGPGGTKFVRSLMKDFRTVGGLIGGIGDVLGALYSTSAPSGRSMLSDFTDTLHEWADWIRKNREKVEKFFENAVKKTEDLADGFGNIVSTLWNLGKALEPLFDFVTFLAKHPAILGLLAGGFAAGKGLKLGAQAFGKSGKLVDRFMGIQGARGPVAPGSAANPIVVTGVGVPGGGGIPGGGKIDKTPGAFRLAKNAGKLSLILLPGILLAESGIMPNNNNPTTGMAAARKRAEVGPGPTGVPFGQLPKSTKTSVTVDGHAYPVDPRLANYPDSHMTDTGARLRGYPDSHMTSSVKQSAKDLADSIGRQNQRIRNDQADTTDKTGKALAKLAGSFTSNLKTVRDQTSMTFPAVFQEMTRWLGRINGTSAEPNGGVAPGPAGTRGSRPHAGGGRIPGVGLQDTVQVAPGAMAAPGELIVNRHTEQRANSMLMRHGFTLGGLVRGETKKHSEGFASGGRVSGLLPGIAKAANAVLSHFPGLSITSTTGGTHAANSYHYRGMAVDIGGPTDVMNAAAAWIQQTMGGSLAEGIHNPNLSIKGGQNVPPSFWGDSTWAGHANHIHLAIAGALAAMAGLGGGALGHRMRQRKIRGRGLAGKIGQTAVNKVRRAAQARLDAAGGGLGVLGGGGSFVAQKGAMTFNQVARLAESVGLPGITFAQIAKGESGFIPTAVGHDPGGTQGLGLWQITTGYNDDIIARFGGRNAMFNPHTNALAAKAIYDRQGLAAWRGTRYLTAPNAHFKGARGGRMPEFAGWFGDGGTVTASKPTYIGIGESGQETATITKGDPGGGRIVVEKVVVYGNEDTKKAVMDAFRDLERDITRRNVED